MMIFNEFVYRDSRTRNTLTRASADVQLYMGRPNFQARWALVATWDNVPPYSYYSNRGSEVSLSTSFKTTLISKTILEILTLS